MHAKPVLIFDGKCSFCRIWIDYFKQQTGDTLDYAASQDVGPGYPQIAPEEFSKSVQLVQADGQVLSGARAVFEILRAVGGMAWVVWLFDHVAAFAILADWGYRFTAAHRNLGYWLARVLFGTKIEPARFRKVEWLFLRLLGMIYLIAFLSFGLQVQGLIGSRGILPLSRFLDAVSGSLGVSGFWQVPTLFWFNSSNAALWCAASLGALLSVVVMLGFAVRLGFAVLFILYLSFCSAGQDFMSFQWDMLLLEAGFLAIFLGQSTLVVWLYRLLLFRLMFLSGAVKLLSGDPNWRGLEALRYHYWTQPLPTPLAWYVNQLPAAFQKASTAAALGIEVGLPFLIFLPRRARFLAGIGFLILQIMILLTGNYTFFNLLAIGLCLFLLDDQALGRFPLAGKQQTRTNPRVAVPLFIVIGGLGLLQLATTLEMPVPRVGRALLGYTSPFGIVNSYGLFASMTTTRPEIAVQGSNNGADWSDYTFKYKAGDLRRAPQWVAPYQPRLDWQMWFAALSNWRANPWFGNFMVRLLQGSPAVLDLLERNPFPDKPPRYVRALLFDYRFTDARERAQSGNWWKREYQGVYLGPVSLADVNGR